MTFDQFDNGLRTLFCIDGWQLPWLSNEQQAKFTADPARFFLRVDDQTAKAIWREVQKAQTRRTA
jgi:hypothetical protein